MAFDSFSNATLVKASTPPLPLVVTAYYKTGAAWFAFGTIVGAAFVLLLNVGRLLKPIKFPMITYPDCDTCDCDGNTDDAPPFEPSSGTSVSTLPVNSVLVPYNIESTYVNLDINFSSYFPSPWSSTDKTSILRLLTGNITNSFRRKNKFI
jgi:hypothetical protein